MARVIQFYVAPDSPVRLQFDRLPLTGEEWDRLMRYLELISEAQVSDNGQAA